MTSFVKDLIKREILHFFLWQPLHPKTTTTTQQRHCHYYNKMSPTWPRVASGSGQLWNSRCNFPDCKSKTNWRSRFGNLHTIKFPAEKPLLSELNYFSFNLNLIRRCQRQPLRIFNIRYQRLHIICINLNIVCIN